MDEKRIHEKIAAVVVTYNRLELLKECIQSLRLQTKKLDEIIVVNNSSTDGTEEWLNEQSDLTVITQENSGSAGGQYTGIKTAYDKGYDWIWCLDADVIPEKDALNQFFNSPEIKMNDVGFLSSAIFDHKKNISYINIPFLPPEKEHAKKFIETGTFEIMSASFGSLLIPRQSIMKVGFPNPAFFIWGDDVDYTFRMYEKNLKGYLIRQSIANHIQDENFKNPFNSISVKNNKGKFAITNMTYCVMYRNLLLKRSIIFSCMSTISFLIFVLKSIKPVSFLNAIIIINLWIKGIIKFVYRKEN